MLLGNYWRWKLERRAQAGGQTKETAPKRAAEPPKGWGAAAQLRCGSHEQRAGETGLLEGTAGKSEATLQRSALPAATNQRCRATQPGIKAHSASKELLTR